MSDRCKECGQYVFTGDVHKCPSKWLAWCEEIGGTEEYAEALYASDAKDAALRWAENYDRDDSVYPIAAKGETLTVCVRLTRLAPGLEVMRFHVSGEFTPSYRAKETDG